MASEKLKPLQVKNAKPGKYEDGKGLRLVVSKGGARKWVFRFTLNGRRREMGLGAEGLAEAREKAQEARKMVKSGIDPIEARRVEPEKTPTFIACAAAYIRAHRRGWRSTKHARQWVSTIRTYTKQQIGKKKVDAITTEDILTILSPVWTSKPETAKRLQGRVETILDFAAARKYRDPLNPARWRGHLDMLLPKPARVKKVVHHPAMPYTDVPGFMRELSDNGSVSALALRFLIHTATRSSEVLQAQWDEIDTEAALWVIPSSRTKTGREHRVPLTDAALSILEALPRIEGNPYLFPGARQGRPLSNMALLQLMRGMGYGVDGDRGDYVPHGFRSSFRDWAGEVSSYPRDICEMALGHAIENKVEAAYRRGDLLTKRTRLMTDWSRFINTPAKSGEVINIRGKEVV